MEEKLRATISYLFGKYDIRRGNENHIRMENVFTMCMNDINSHPCLIEGLDAQEKIEFFVTQTIFGMIPLEEVKPIVI